MGCPERDLSVFDLAHQREEGGCWQRRNRASSPGVSRERQSYKQQAHGALGRQGEKERAAKRRALEDAVGPKAGRGGRKRSRVEGGVVTAAIIGRLRK